MNYDVETGDTYATVVKMCDVHHNSGHGRHTDGDISTKIRYATRSLFCTYVVMLNWRATCSHWLVITVTISQMLRIINAMTPFHSANDLSTKVWLSANSCFHLRAVH